MLTWLIRLLYLIHLCTLPTLCCLIHLLMLQQLFPSPPLLIKTLCATVIRQYQHQSISSTDRWKMDGASNVWTCDSAIVLMWGRASQGLSLDAILEPRKRKRKPLEEITAANNIWARSDWFESFESFELQCDCTGDNSAVVSPEIKGPSVSSRLSHKSLRCANSVS